MCLFLKLCPLFHVIRLNTVLIYLIVWYIHIIYVEIMLFYIIIIIIGVIFKTINNLEMP
jgi:hypothetical protein